MCRFNVTALICLVLAAFLVGSNAEENEEGVLDEIHEELALQLMEEEQAGVSGEELAAKLREGRRVLHELVQEESRQSKGAKCTVEGFTAKCCAGTSFKVFWKRVEFNACVEATFLPEEMGLHLKITVRGSTVFEKKIAAGNANGICVKVPKLRAVSVCLKLSNLQAEGGHFSGCLGLQPKVFGKTIKTLNLGCISLP
ncbi:uncharacterized protein LOC119725760 isoform X2 [Patiria miniata]|uniref:DUF4773 domain-containing protein n=1 Tax=Patiria miniata TaxID=46514 RepID=A0A913ZN78_PATMI|nr:uncharacterized protein LOC119725760 isoform X2 [Patiria miniata]